MKEYPVHNCLSCHFLAKKKDDFGLDQLEPISHKERELLVVEALPNADQALLCCFHQLWDEAKAPVLVASRRSNIAEKDREGLCHFLDYNPNISFEIAQKMRVRKKEVPRIEKFVLIGERSWLVWLISAAVLLASILYVKF